MGEYLKSKNLPQYNNIRKWLVVNDVLYTAADWKVESNYPGAMFGISVSTAGDVNGDGYSDIIVGAYEYDNGQTDEGRVFVFYGNGGAGLSLAPQQWGYSDSSPITYTAWGHKFTFFYFLAKTLRSQRIQKLCVLCAFARDLKKRNLCPR